MSVDERRTQLVTSICGDLIAAVLELQAIVREATNDTELWAAGVQRQRVEAQFKHLEDIVADYDGEFDHLLAAVRSVMEFREPTH